MKNKEKITMGTILFVDSQYIVTAILMRVFCAVTGLADKMTTGTAIVYFSLLYLLFAVGALEDDDD